MSDDKVTTNPPTDIETAKLDFERQKLKLEEGWKRRTFVWTIASALLTAIVTISVAMIAKGGSSSSGPKIEITSRSVESCRDSLKRLPTLARVTGQTVPQLTDAIDAHERTCDEVLVDLLAELAK